MQNPSRVKTMKFTLRPLCVRLVFLAMALSCCSARLSAAIVQYSGGSAHVEVEARAAGLAPTVIDSQDASVSGSGSASAAKSAKTVGTMKYQPWDPGVRSANISGLASVSVSATEVGGQIGSSLSAQGQAYGSNGGFAPLTAGIYGGSSAASVVYTAAPGSKFSLRAFWSANEDANYLVGINGVGYNNTQATRSVHLTGLTFTAIGATLSMDFTVAPTKFEPISKSQSGTGSLHWSLTDFWPGERPESSIDLPFNKKPLKDGELPIDKYDDSGISEPVIVTGSQLTSFPVGAQGIGTDTPLYVNSPYARLTSAARQAVAVLPDSSATSNDVQFRYQSSGPLFTHFVLPAALASGDVQFELRVGSIALPVTAGTEVNLLGIAPTGVSEFVLAGIDPGVLGTEADPLDVLVGLRFATGGDTVVVLTLVPEPAAWAMALCGLATVVYAASRRRRRR